MLVFLRGGDEGGKGEGRGGEREGETGEEKTCLRDSLVKFCDVSEYVCVCVCVCM